MKSWEDCDWNEGEKEESTHPRKFYVCGIGLNSGTCLEKHCPIIKQQKEIDGLKNSHNNMWDAHNKLWESEKKYEGDVKRGLENQIEKLEKEIENNTSDIACLLKEIGELKKEKHIHTIQGIDGRMHKSIIKGYPGGTKSGGFIERRKEKE